MHKGNCICQSNKRFEQCCQPLLQGKAFAKTPVKLMRSRYSAFALGGFGLYLKQTWSPDVAHGLDEDELSIRSLDWQNLEIIAKSQNGDQATVEFKAHFLDDEGDAQVHHERSQFQRVSGKWYYTQGEVL